MNNADPGGEGGGCRLFRSYLGDFPGEEVVGIGLEAGQGLLDDVMPLFLVLHL